MGRIADALKRAEQERHASARFPAQSPGAPTACSELTSSISTIDSPLPAPAERRSDKSVALVEGLSESLVPYFDHSSLVTEQYRSLRTRLLSQNPNYEHRIFAITSAVPKEGKSVTTLNLGAVLSEISHLKVLVVDGDLRRGCLAKMLNQDAKPGMAELLSGEATYPEVIRDTPIPNLKFISAGDKSGRAAAELWTAAKARSIFRCMHNDFHYTIVDTPPATTVTDVGIIGQLCHGVLMVVRLHHTDELAAKRAVRLLEANNISILGCTLVGRDSPPGHYGYGYGYSYYRYYDDNNKPEDK